ncbi:MAG: CoA-binding protein [Candidatus Omnitrophica bacterium]|nr:CoA-binding protein [Candidatus Omnitrophota bacterium]
MKKYKNVAVVGLSSNPEKPSHYVAKYLKEHGWNIFPVNPTLKGEVLGEKVYASLSDVPVNVEIVEIFRPPSEALPVVKDAIERGSKVVWMQVGIVNNEAAKLARAAGLTVVMDKCMMALHQRSAQ